MNKILSRVAKFGGAGAVAAALIAGTIGYANAGTERAPTAVDTAAAAIPSTLAVPAGNRLLGIFQARGVQVYTCTAGAWVFTEPVATLTGRARGAWVSAVHFRGPSWESVEDGSLVTAAAVANSPVAGTIPQLLLKASANAGTGVFGTVTYIQRLATSGGVAPAGACTDGARTGVPYRADYRFYVAA